MGERKDGGPAFGHGNHAQGGDPGMSLRQYAAIHLRVPDSGVEWLDEMIRKAKRDEFAGMALQGMWASTRRDDFLVARAAGQSMTSLMAKSAYEQADAMLARHHSQERDG